MAKAKGNPTRATRRVQIGTVGVDAGMLLMADPCYVIDAPLGRRPWKDFLREIAGPEGHLTSYAVVEGETPNGSRYPAGIVVVSGAGDGEYPVYAEFTAEAQIARVTIDFGLLSPEKVTAPAISQSVKLALEQMATLIEKGAISHTEIPKWLRSLSEGPKPL